MSFGLSIQNMWILLNTLKHDGMKSIVGICLCIIPPDQYQTGVNSREQLKEPKESSLMKKSNKKQEAMGSHELG